MGGEIRVLGARENNLKNIDVVIPHNKLVVITGLSGSGKSSLAFNTLFAEGQRRYMETLSAYARQFIGNMERPDVDKISGLSPVIAIEQKTVNKNPRSTVGTITEIYDYLRLLYARASDAFSMESGEKMVRYTDDKIIEMINSQFAGHRIYLLSPLVKGRKGHYKELFEQLRRKGFLTVRVNGKFCEIMPSMHLDRYKSHFIELVIDKLVAGDIADKRLRNSILLALDQGDGMMMVFDADTNQTRYFSRRLMCPTTGISYAEPAPFNFSFNSPQGACPHCNGLGVIASTNEEKLMPEMSLSIREGGIAPIGKYHNSLIFWQLEALCEKDGSTIDTPLCELSRELLNKILYGSDELLRLSNTPLGASSNYSTTFNGIINYLQNIETITHKRAQNRFEDDYVEYKICPECGGTRLKKESLFFKIGGKNIGELANMDIGELYHFFENIDPIFDERQKAISREIVKELRSRISFLLEVGLDYLSLNRSSGTLSGGESQRIRLATQIGSKLVNVLYILDEPSIGLHQRDNNRLIESLKKLRDAGNSIIVVEHDREIMKAADWIIDIGPGAGRLGGNVVASGRPTDIMHANTATAQYLNGEKTIEPHRKVRIGNGKTLTIVGARGNNLKNITVLFPLGTFICVTGVSGSGKSSLIKHTLHAAISKRLYRSLRQPLPYDEICGIENINKIIEVDQSPIGRTPRSNPATFCGVFTDIRKLFEQTTEAKIRGFSAGRFSFNIRGGRCEACEGAGVKTIEMNFLPNVYVKCSECNGKRYNRETLEVKYKGKSIADVLDMTINMAVEFFANIPSICQKLKVLQEVGLGYIRLGQSSTTLSGGEAQRIKLASELARKDTGDTLYILDEPTTGLHFDDVKVLLGVINRLVDKGNTIIVIEHNTDVIKCADWIIDLGPEGGKRGGELIFEGTPKQCQQSNNCLTGQYLTQNTTTTPHKQPTT